MSDFETMGTRIRHQTMADGQQFIDRSRFATGSATGSKLSNSAAVPGRRAQPIQPVKRSPRLLISRRILHLKRKALPKRSPMKQLSHRLAFGGLALLLGFTVAIPLFNAYVTHHRYALSPDTVRLVGDVNKNLSNKITYDGQTGSYYFNKSGIKSDNGSPAAALAAETGGEGKKDKSLYSVQLPADATQGITYYDDNLGLSFQVIPQIKLAAAQEEQGRIVYAGSGIQDVFTAKGNGLKDDIVLTKPMGDQLSYSYSLKLPDTLQAKTIDGTGEVGIYSADPTLYNNISFGSDTDRNTVMQARKNGAKTNLVFVLPAPEIKQYNSTTNQAVAAPGSASHFVLNNDGQTLTVIASGLSKLSYPLTIDPSVVTTSTSDFLSGNNEDGNIDYSTSGQINRGGLTGGSLNTTAGSWTTNGASLKGATNYASSATLNGYVYEIGGLVGGSYSNTVSYAALSSSGGIGTATYTTAPLPAAIVQTSAVAYDGYIYVIGGTSSGSTAGLTTVYYAQPTATGDITAWSSSTAANTPALPQGVAGATADVYNGYVYVMGGFTSSASSPTTSVYYASLNANGSTGSWSAGTGLSTAVYNLSSFVSNGFIYELGGAISGGTAQTAVSYAAINGDGSLGSWVSGTALPKGLIGATTVTYNGYVYEIGGFSTSSQSAVYYASLSGSGVLGSWTATTSLTATSIYATSVVYNGYIYEMGGTVGGSNSSAIYYAKVDPTGVTGAYTTGKALTLARSQSTTVVYNGYIYEIGGLDNSGTPTPTSTIYWATLNVGGAIGTWATMRLALPQALAGASAVAYDGYLYIMGGNDTTPTLSLQSTVYYAPLNPSNGNFTTSGSWTTAGTLPSALYNAGAVVYNTTIYLIGGNTGTASTANVSYASLSQTGAIGTWTTPTAGSTSNLPQAISGATTFINGNTVYVMGGTNTAAVSGAQSTIYYSVLPSASGAAGAWTTSSVALPQNLVYASGAEMNGYIYELGGENASGTNQTTSYYAKLNTDNSLNAWATTVAQTAALNNATAAAVGGYLYVIGGVNSSATTVSVTYQAQINNGGTGQATGWVSTTALPVPIDDACTVAYNGYIYVVGGQTTGNNSVQTVYYTSVSSTGVIGSWNTTTQLPVSVYEGGGVAYNGYLYVIGGSTVYSAPINANGTLGNWSASGSSLGSAALPSALTLANAVVYNGYMYVNGFSTTAYYGQIGSNGIISAWSTGTGAPNYFGATYNGFNGYLYAVGGVVTGGFAVQVYYSQLSSSGFGAWTATSSMSILGSGSWALTTDNGYIYAVSQYNSTAYALYAPINANGSLGQWTATSTATTVSSAGLVNVNGIGYYIGGANNTGVIKSTVNYSPLASIPRISHYSKMIDLGSAVNVSSITYNGVLAAGLQNISYRLAGTNAVFGSTVTAASLANTATMAGSCATTETLSRYIWVDLTMDDSGSTGNFSAVGFPDVAGGTSANVTDFTVTYSASAAHPSPGQRLRMGQVLQTGTLSGLDTCGAV